MTVMPCGNCGKYVKDNIHGTACEHCGWKVGQGITIACTPSAASAGYRWLENGEAFQKNDEFATTKKLTGIYYLTTDPNDDSVEWMPIPRDSHKKIFFDHEYKGTRRKR